MHWAIRNYKPGYIYHGTDICVPISKLPEAIEYCQKLFQILGVEGKCYRIAARILVGKIKLYHDLNFQNANRCFGNPILRHVQKDLTFPK